MDNELIQTNQSPDDDDDSAASVATDGRRRSQAHAQMAGAHGRLAEVPGYGLAPQSERGPDAA